MAYNDVSASGMNYTTLRQLINDYIITLDPDDYVSTASDAAIRNIALRGIREFGFDVTSRIKSLKLPVNSDNNTISLPDDYVDLTKIGIIGGDGLLRVLRMNKNINYSQRIVQNADGSNVTSTTNSNLGPSNIPENLILDREDSKTGADSLSSSGDYSWNVFQNYIYQGGLGRLYGAGGGNALGEYRINLDQNRIEIDTATATTEVVIEYVSDEARSTNPVIHVYAEEALRAYLYYKLCERKSSVPANEKARARAEYYNERRKAKARFSSFTKDEALTTIRKNFKQSLKA